MNFLYL